VDAINAMQANGLKSVETIGPEIDEPVAEVVEDLIHFSLRLDTESVDRLLERGWRNRGPMDFMSHLAGPLLVEVGTRWARGEIGVATEHFISERLRDFLSTRWRAANASAQAAKVVCACLPGERHVIGLHLAAVAAALAGVHVVFLGADTPIRDILSAVDRVGAKAGAVSVAGGASTDLLTHQLKVVRRGLPRQVSLWIGGTGAGAAVLPERSEYLHNLERLQTLASRLAEDRTPL
ncbi:MAG TPA: hypothetical protein DCQ06_00270, partial [Myxococcales bacterium]|nr:hypothetical protein [Myxococcales bacterium]